MDFTVRRDLSQWLERWDALESQATQNPFAVVVMAQLQALRYPDKSTRLAQERKMSYVTIAERMGIKKGREEGQADLLLRLMERRFGPVPEAITQRVRAAGVEQLELWALNFVDAVTPEQVFRE